ncbi:MAG: hypothetical protein ACRDTC_09385 [Pseudonocardiaceae bacterium]
MVKSVLMVAVVLAAQAGDGGCAPQGDGVVRSRVCDVDTRGIEVERDGAVIADVVTARCDVPPTQHRLDAWLEYRSGAWGGWTMPRFPEGSSLIPDVEGVAVRVTLPCKEGYYRAAWRATGRGPALPDHPRGIEFDIADADLGHTRINTEDCEG